MPVKSVEFGHHTCTGANLPASQVLLLDEPLAGLDWRARLEVAGVLQQLKKECTILVVSHDLRELTPLVRLLQL